MGALGLTYRVTGGREGRLSAIPPFHCLTVTFQTAQPYAAFACYATKKGESYGRGRGTLIASFSATPAETARQFEVYDTFLLQGDGAYRISLYVQGEDGVWNDNHAFLLADTDVSLHTADGTAFLCMR